MTETQLANVLQLSVVGILWSILIFKILPMYRVDSFRQKMFCVRDEMFDYAANGNIEFNDPAYVLLRRQMNGFIRYGHQLTVFRGLITVAIHKISGNRHGESWHAEWQRRLNDLEDDAVRENLKEFHERAMMLAVKRLLTGSPLLWMALAIFMVELIFQGAATGVRQLAKAASKKVFTGPINDRLIEEAALGGFA
jgi:hypothetical protein